LKEIILSFICKKKNYEFAVLSPQIIGSANCKSPYRRSAKCHMGRRSAGTCDLWNLFVDCPPLIDANIKPYLEVSQFRFLEESHPTLIVPKIQHWIKCLISITQAVVN
jgi:hypothetical protein